VLDGPRGQRLRLQVAASASVVAHADADHVAELRAECHVALQIAPEVGERRLLHVSQEFVEARDARGLGAPGHPLPDILLDVAGLRPEVAGNRLDVQHEVHGAPTSWTTTRFFPSRLAAYIASSAAARAAAADSGARSNAIAPMLALTRGSPGGNGAR